MKVLITILLFVSLLPGLSAWAQNAELPPLASVRENAIWLTGFNAEPQPVTANSARDYWNLTWSPDGRFLAFFELDQDFTIHLKLYDRLTETTTSVASGIEVGFPLDFAPDSSQLFFVNGALSYEAGPAYTMTFYTYDLGAEAAPQPTAMFDYGVGCGGGSPFPPDWRYNAETMGLGGFHLVLKVTPFGLVHSMDCGGSHTGLLDLQTNEDVDLGPLSRAAVSADRTKVAGIIDLAGTRENETLVVVDLLTLTRADLETTQTPDQVSWGASGSTTLFYSTRQNSGRMMDFDAESLQQISAIQGDNTMTDIWEVSLHQLDLDTGAATELHRAEAFAIGRMIPTPDGQTLLFSQIPNAEAWFQAIAEGRLTMNDTQNNVSASLVPVQLFRLPLSGGEAVLLGSDFNKAALNSNVDSQ